MTAKTQTIIRKEDAMENKVYGIKIYTKTIHEKVNGSYVPKMVGVIEAPIDKMMKAYKDEFSFMRHETKRSMRAKGLKQS